MSQTFVIDEMEEEEVLTNLRIFRIYLHSCHVLLRKLFFRDKKRSYQQMLGNYLKALRQFEEMIERLVRVIAARWEKLNERKSLIVTNKEQLEFDQEKAEIYVLQNRKNFYMTQFIYSTLQSMVEVFYYSKYIVSQSSFLEHQI